MAPTHRMSHLYHQWVTNELYNEIIISLKLVYLKKIKTSKWQTFAGGGEETH